MHEAFFFGPGDRQLFGSYHPPVHGNGQVLTVLCPPLFLDHTRTQLILRRVATCLAEKGQHVLRFDYRGTGDSFSDLEDVVVSDWIADIELAVQEGRAASGSRKVRLLGVRAGALVAARFASASADVDRLVLWDPVRDGAAYLEELRGVQTTLLERHPRLRRPERSEAIRECAGYRISERLLGDFGGLSARAYSGVPRDKVRIVSTSSDKRLPIEAVSHDVVQVACQWGTDVEDLIMPQPELLDRLISGLTAP